MQQTSRKPFSVARQSLLALGLASICVLPALADDADWKPTHPINLIVPWAAGGATDQVTRLTAAELEKSLGQTIVIINQPGASGAIGTKSALDAPHDGYTWTAGAVQDLGAYETLGSLKTRASDWHLFLSVANVPTLAVSASSPYQTAKDLIAAMAAKPGKISVATAGVTSSGHAAMDMVAKAANITYRHVTYDGGNPAVVATVAGETDVTSQLTSEEAEMIRGKMLRPLATISDQSLVLDGFGPIPPLSDTLPGFTAPTSYYGIFVPAGVPDEVVHTLEKIWKEKIAEDQVLKNFASSRGALFAPAYGSIAQKLSFPAVQANAWMLFNNGQAKVSPDTVGIPKP